VANSTFDGTDAGLDLRLDSSTAAPHPEEMKGSIRFAFGPWGSLTISGRATPAGLVCAALLACAVLVPTLSALRRRHSR